MLFFFNLINKFYLDFFTEPKRLKGLQLFMVSFYVYGSLKLFVFLSYLFKLLLELRFFYEKFSSVYFIYKFLFSFCI